MRLHYLNKIAPVVYIYMCVSVCMDAMSHKQS